MSAAGVTIVGGGIAGQSVCEAGRGRDPDVPLTLVCAEYRPPYDRVRLSELLASGDETASLELRPPEWYEDHGVRLLLGRRAVRVDSERRSLELGDGERL